MLQAQGLPYSKRVKTSQYQDSLKDFLVATGKQLDIKSEAPKQNQTRSKAPNKRSENVGGLGSKHAKLLLRLLKSCSDEMVTNVVTSLREEQMDILSQLIESCPLEMTGRVVRSLVEMGTEEVKSLTKEKLEKLVENLTQNRPEIPHELQEVPNVKVHVKDEGREMELADDTFVDGLTSKDLDEIYTNEGEHKFDENEMEELDENEVCINEEELDENLLP